MSDSGALREIKALLTAIQRKKAEAAVLGIQGRHEGKDDSRARLDAAKTAESEAWVPALKQAAYRQYRQAYREAAYVSEKAETIRDQVIELCDKVIDLCGEVPPTEAAEALQLRTKAETEQTLLSEAALDARAHYDSLLPWTLLHRRL